MFDYYEPILVPECWRCGSGSMTFQGKDGPNLLFVWRQGHAHPVDHHVDDHWRVAADEYSEYTLPDRFMITGWCENGHHCKIQCRCKDGIWVDSDFTAEIQRADERKARERLERWRNA